MRVGPIAIAGVAIALVIGCEGRAGDERRGAAALLPVSLPDLSRMDAPVQEQARQRHAALTQKLAAGGAGADLGAAFGELGMLLHAAEDQDAAEPAYRNAQVLMPDDPRWPYYLAHLYKSKGDPAKSVDAFKRALDRQPTALATLVWLARMHLDQGQPDLAEPLLARAQSAAPRTAAVLAALGQTALTRQDYARAAPLFEEALSLNPRAASIHAPLAQAYRGLGDTARAEAHLARWRNTEIPVPDPWMEQLAMTLQSGLSYELRGVRAFDARRWEEAASIFRGGLTLTPPETPVGRSLRHKLGLSLYLAGDARAAVQQFEEAIRLAPSGGHDEPAARAHYSLGIIMASSGRGAEAIEHLSKAIVYDPTYLEAHVALGDARRRDGRADASLTHYREAVRINPQAAEARFGYGIALVRLRRFVDARAWFETAVREQPDRPELAHALARILAAAPDARARDGRRAVALAQELLETNKHTDMGETMAMALAEVGEHAQAVSIQRGVMQAAERAGLVADVRRMAGNLRLYEQQRACRTPWPDDDKVHLPGPPISLELGYNRP